MGRAYTAPSKMGRNRQAEKRKISAMHDSKPLEPQFATYQCAADILPMAKNDAAPSAAAKTQAPTGSPSGVGRTKYAVSDSAGVLRTPYELPDDCDWDLPVRTSVSRRWPQHARLPSPKNYYVIVVLADAPTRSVGLRLSIPHGALSPFRRARERGRGDGRVSWADCV